MAQQRALVRASDGRTLEIVTAGPAEATPLVYHHGTPSGPVLLEELVQAAAAAGLRVVGYARPGYAGSDRAPGRSVADAAADVAAILDEQGAGPFVTLGLSGGGPHALACAALLPGRCLAAATIGSVAPPDAAGLDFLAGMGPENVEELGLAQRGSAALTPFLTTQLIGMADVRAEELALALGRLVSDVDRVALDGPVGEWLAASMRSAVSRGIDGWHDDDLATVRSWGFAPADITVPVAIWQGGQDLMVPAAHGAWLAAAVPGARAHLLDEHGHLSLLVDHLPKIVADLVELAGLAGCL